MIRPPPGAGPLAIFAVVTAAAILVGTPRQPSAEQRPHRPPVTRLVALTFDDLPLTAQDGRSVCDPARVRAWNARLLERLAAHGIPAAGFVVAGRACGPDPQRLLDDVLGAWLEAGHELGNHTHSHRDIDAVSLERYLSDIVRGQGPIDRVSAPTRRRARYFRPPLLHMGATPEKRSGLRQFLAEHDYRLAPVTIDNQEWVFAAVYARAVERGADELARAIVEAYLEHMEESFEFYERLSRDVVGREIPQILLLHANLLNIDHLDTLVGLIRSRGYEFISLQAALEDPAYRLPDEYVGPRGLSWLQRWALTRGDTVPPEPREPRWIGELFRRP